MDLFTKDWGTCLDKTVDTTTGVATLSCIWVLISNIINAALVLSAVAAVFLIVYAGFQYVTSSGDKEKVDNARKRLTYAILGLIFIFFSFMIVNFIAFTTGVNPDQLRQPPQTQPGLQKNPTSKP